VATYVREAHRLTDPDLVRAAQIGDEHALEALLRGLAEELLPVANALTGASADADVLVGDTLSRVYERLGDLREPAAALSWARRVLVRRFIDGRRWSLRRPTYRLDAVTVAAGLETRPELIDLRDAVRDLRREDRALLVLHYWQGLSIAECAHELGVPDGTAKSRLAKALERLRRRLGEGDR
jgi:RNA polymerase sigma factor (sigma-70 family)